MALACVIACPGLALAGETDVLVQKLVEKGVLTPYEAQIVLDETKQEVAKQNAKGTNDAIPSWVQTVKIKGDMRARYQLDADKNQKNESRGRLRMRLGVDAKPNDQMKVGIGLASGNTGDPRSTNSTWGNSATANTPAGTSAIILDYAYGEYKPLPALTLTAGKFKNPLWQPNDMLWDTDLNPDGLAVQLSSSLLSNLDLYMNNMLFVMYENRSADYSDPMMLAVQPGFKYDVTDNVSLQGAVTYYQNSNVGNRSTFASTKSTNSISGGKYRYNYNALQPSAELGFSNIFGDWFLPYVALSGDYVYNTSMQKGLNGRDGWDAAVKFGDKKVSDKGMWQGKLMYARLGRDAFLDIFPDSDRYSGKTNMKSYEGILEYGLGKNTSLVFDYYRAESLTKSGATTTPQQVFQVDWNLKF
jgi:hypothetical protein